jgi:uncharacterized membrane protein (DUF485 family)
LQGFRGGDHYGVFEKSLHCDRHGCKQSYNCAEGAALLWGDTLLRRFAGCDSWLFNRWSFTNFFSMPPTKNAKFSGLRAETIRAVSTPLGFYVLSLLIVEATIGLVLTAAKLSEDHVWRGFFVAIGLFLLVFIVVTILVIWFPKNLLFGKEEHSNPALEPSALRDAIEEIITEKVKHECLKCPTN